MDEFLRQSRLRAKSRTVQQLCGEALGGGIGVGVALVFFTHAWRQALAEAVIVALGLLLWLLWLRRS